MTDGGWDAWASIQRANRREIAQVAKPMIGWATDTQLCDHDLPVEACGCEVDE